MSQSATSTTAANGSSSSSHTNHGAFNGAGPTATSANSPLRRSSHRKQQHRSKSNKNGVLDSGFLLETPLILQYDRHLVEETTPLSQQQQEDHAHNRSTPCCALIRAAALDIVPENHDPAPPIVTAGGEQLAPPASAAATTTTTASTTLPATTLLGRLAKGYLLLHQRQRQMPKTTSATPVARNDEVNGDGEDDDENNNDNAAATAKRKKKKKKKKKATTATLSGDDDTHSLPDGNDVVNHTATTNHHDNHVERDQPKPNVATLATNGNNGTNGSVHHQGMATMPDTSTTTTTATTTATAATTTTTTNKGEANAGSNNEKLVDSCLDAIMATNSSSSLTLPSSNRTMESFLTFLSQRLPQYQSSSSMERQNHLKKKQGDDNDTITTSTTSTTTTTSVAKRKKAAPASSSSSGGTVEKSFSLSVETLLAMCNKIHCVQCRQSAITVLSSMVQEHRKQRLAIEQQRAEDISRSTAMSSRATTPCFPIHTAAAALSMKKVPTHASHLAIPVTSRTVNSTNQFDVDNDDSADLEMERAFDYVALEEGTNVHHDSEHAVQRMVLEEAAALSDKLVLHLEQNETMLVLTNGVAAFGNPHMMETFLRSIVLACGLEAHRSHDDNQRTFALDERQFQTIRERVQEKERNIAGELDAIGMQLGCTESQLEELCRSSRTPNHDEEESSFEVKSIPDLRKCDRECLDIANAMLTFLRRLTKEYHTLLLKTAGSNALDMVMERLWEGFFEAATGMMATMDEYHFQIAQMANRDVLPKLFIHAGCRRAYRQMLENKLGYLSTYYRHMFNCLQGPKEGDNNRGQAQDGSSFLRCVRDHYYYYFLRGMYTTDAFCDIAGTGQARSMDDSQTKLDELWCNATHQLLSCASTICCCYVSEMDNEHRFQRDKLDELQLSFFQTIKAQYNHVTEKHRLPEWYMRHWQELVNQYMTLQRQRKEADPEAYVSQAHLQQQGLFQGITVVMFQLWSHTNTIVCHVHRSKEPQLSMPPELKKWMSEGGKDRGAVMRGLPSEVPCSGGGGKRRLTSLLAGFIYRWLADRCEEWNSELAEAELLTSVETTSLMDGNDQALTTSSKTVKAGKKNRRKRDKKSTALDSSVSLNLVVEPSDDANSNDGSDDDQVDAQANDLADPPSLQPKNSSAYDELPITTLGDAVTDNSISLTKDNSHDRETEANDDTTVPPQTGLCDEAIESPGDCVVTNGNTNSEFSPGLESFSHFYDQSYDHASSICIVDAFGSETAEDFLVGRLLKLLNGQDPYVRL